MSQRLKNIAALHIQNQKSGMYPDQKSEEWIKSRLNMLTASVCATALDCNTYESSRELLVRKVSTKLGVLKDRSNSNMEWGNKYEPVAKKMYENLFSTKVYEIGLVTHPLYEWLGASPDGMTSAGKLLEIKCPVNRKVGEVPYNYWIQVQIQLEVCNLDTCDFMDCEFAECSEDQYKLIDGNKIIKGVMGSTKTSTHYWTTQNYIIHTIRRDKVWFQNNINYLKIFWGKVILYREKGQKKLNEDTKHFVYNHDEPIPISVEVNSPRLRRSKRRANVLQDDPGNSIPCAVQKLKSKSSKQQRMVTKQTYCTSTEPNNGAGSSSKIAKQTGELIDWSKWISATQTRNYVIEDPLIDWLEYHGNQHTYECKVLRSTENAGCIAQEELNENVTKIQTPDCESYRSPETVRANYDVGERFESDLRNSMLFSNFLKENGTKFEKYVMKELISKFPDDILIIANQYQARSLRKYEETAAAMRKGIPIIYHGVLHNHKNRTYGMPDLIVRSDWLNKIFSDPIISETSEKDKARYLKMPTGKSWHYRIVDIKFTTLNLRADGKHLLKSSSVEAMKSQLYVYNMALQEMQGYNPAKAYIIGRKWNFKKNSVISSGEGCFDRAGHINFKTTDMHIRKKTRDALVWIHKVRRYGHTFTVIPPSCAEMYPNMSNGLDGPWRRVKAAIAKEIFEITDLWQCGVKNRNIAYNIGVLGWNHPRCIAETFGVRGDKVTSTLQQILDCNQDPEIYIERKMLRSGGEINGENSLDTEDLEETREEIRSDIQIIIPHKIQGNLLSQWHSKKNTNKKNTLFVDFETKNDLNLDNEFARSSYIFMIGIVYRDIATEECLYKCFYTNDLTEQEECRIFLQFHEFIRKFSKDIKGEVLMPNLIHWSHAEKTFYQAAWRKHGDKVLKAGYDKIINWCDMLKIFKDEPITIRGALNFSLKSIAKAFYKHGFIKTTWDDSECGDGMAAMVLALKCYRSVSKGELRLGPSNDIMSIPTMKTIRSYNEVDCRVLQEIMDYLIKHH
jgi:putative phage-type endonuclease